MDDVHCNAAVPLVNEVRMAQQQVEEKASVAVWLRRVVLGILCLFCLGRAYLFVADYAANVPFSDQWDLLNPLFDGDGIAGWFLYQHGPHRQGLGGVLTLLVGRRTDFDGRAEAMLCLVMFSLATAAALALRYRLNGRLGWIDLVWPFVFLSARHGHHLAVVPNNAHSATPLVLILGMACLLTLRRSWWRDALLVLIGFLSTFTGFAIFIAPFVTLMFVLDALAAWRAADRRAAITLVAFAVVSILSAATFLIGYRLETSNPNFGVASATAYARFLADLFSLTFTGVSTWIGQTVGGALCVAIVAVTVAAAWRSFARTPRTQSDDRTAAPIEVNARLALFLGGFTLLFALFCMVGRATFQDGAGGEPRYFAMLIPGLIALSLTIERVRWRPVQFLTLITFAFVIMCGHAVPTRRELASQAEYHNLKEAWRYLQLQTGSARATYERFPFDIYTKPTTDFDAIDRKCRYLRENRLNMYRVGG